nr:immunoglobulin heavy chain junction region [Mus musculus]MBK4184210.1 immunoglobulin heavy chain junction region [Mus musculus]MBK4184211.1 immunoglobulin heavy chain junction region [Mus musculus]
CARRYDGFYPWYFDVW